MKNCPTPHINACEGDFAKTVLMPGDPLRAKYIAENFLKNPVLVNNVRGIHGYTGWYKGVRVSVMASGMGMPSMGIYAHELFNFFGVENIIRVGSAGALQKEIELRDLVLAMGASTDSNFAHKYGLAGTLAPLCSYKLLKKCTEKAEELKVKYHVGAILTTDNFYAEHPKWADMGVLAVDMETAALYMTAAESGKNALAICTVSDSLVTGKWLDTEQRETTLNDMIRLALETAAEC